MASGNTICKNLLHVKDSVIESQYFLKDASGVVHFRIKAHPNKRNQCRCPVCNRKCVKDGKAAEHKLWRGTDFGGIIVEIEGSTQRIKCPLHGSIVSKVPWAYPGSSFTKEFEMTVAWLATRLSKSAVSEYMRIDWKTVGRCVSRTLNEIEPDRNTRLDGLVNIGIDETSYKKGHQYITVVVNHDTNTVVWAHQGHGKAVLELFYKELTQEQRDSIKVVTGDGARWITDCINEFTPECDRCIDQFHVVEWATEALDEVRREEWRKAYSNVKKVKREINPKRGRPSAANEKQRIFNDTKEFASEIKNSAYTLGKAPENLTENQQSRLQIIAETSPRLFRAYRIKEELRLLLKMKDTNEAEAQLKHWLWWASHCKIPVFCELSKKIRRNKKHILNTIRTGLSNARIEATNNKIKLVIRKAYGFRNIDNLLNMVYLTCSNLTIPLPNRIIS